MAIAPTWLLLEADWCHNHYSSSLMKHCSSIVTVGRVKWFGDGGKTNYAWYRFSAQHTTGATFVPRAPNPKTKKQKQSSGADSPVDDR
jgi:hypothetical protein